MESPTPGERVLIAESYRHVKAELRRLRRDLQRRLGFEGIMGSSPAIRRVFEMIERVAPTPSIVLITGESGTGKELVARAIHARSQRADREFVAVNIAAIPGEVLESQLFGHEKGAFTGANRSREGVLRSVRDGTVFFDEVGELSSAVQAKLLRAIESKEVWSVGADRPTQTNARIIAASNQVLTDAIAEGTFREDLYYRLNVFRVDVPPLRERREDIPALVRHFLRLHGRALGRPMGSVSSQAMQLLVQYAWPGNVRELSNLIERALILADGAPIGREHLPSDLAAGTVLPLSLRAAVAESEKRHISWVLRSVEGNREAAARLLKVDRATLYRRLVKYSLR